MPLVVLQRSLRREMVDDRSGQNPAETAGRIRARLGERAVGGPLVGDDLIARGVVGLHEDSAAEPGADWPGDAGERRSGEAGGGGERDGRDDACSETKHVSAPRSWK